MRKFIAKQPDILVQKQTKIIKIKLTQGPQKIIKLKTGSNFRNEQNVQLWCNKKVKAKKQVNKKL